MLRGEIWLIDFNPTIGPEISKILPAVIVSSDTVGVLPLKIVAPITTWQDRFAQVTWFVPLTPSHISGTTIGKKPTHAAHSVAPDKP